MPISHRGPSSTSRIAPSGPPIRRTAPPLSEVSELAALSSGPVPTTAGTRASRAGPYKTMPVFSPTRARYSTQYRPGASPASIAATEAAHTRLAAIIRRRRSSRSLNTPAIGPSSTSGTYSAAAASPVSRSDPVTWRMCAGMAMVSSHVPRLLITPPAHSSRKSRTRSAWSMRDHPFSRLF